MKRDRERESVRETLDGLVCECEESVESRPNPKDNTEQRTGRQEEGTLCQFLRVEASLSVHSTK